MQVYCTHGLYPNWKMEYISYISSSTSANVYQVKGRTNSSLVIKSVNPSNAGTYTCESNGRRERVAIGKCMLDV